LAVSGLITRQRRHDDERTVEINPTVKGRGLMREAASVPTELAAVMGLSPDEGRKLRALLRKLVASLERHATDTTAGARALPRAGER